MMGRYILKQSVEVGFDVDENEILFGTDSKWVGRIKREYFDELFELVKETD